LGSYIDVLWSSFCVIRKSLIFGSHNENGVLNCCNYLKFIFIGGFVVERGYTCEERADKQLVFFCDGIVYAVIRPETEEYP